MSLREKRISSKGRKEILEIIKTCKAIENREFSPFLLNVEQALMTLEKYLRFWRSAKEQCLDSEALNEISKVITLQESQLRFQSSTFYIDPRLLNIKFKSLPQKKLADAFISSWHPIVELEQLTAQNLENALEYWQRLLPIEERLQRLKMGRPIEAQELDLEGLSKIGILSGEDFSLKLEKLWNELKENFSANGKVEYQHFVRNKEFSRTVDRAYCISFLITHGYVNLAKDGKKLLLIPCDKKDSGRRKSVSFPISISKKDRFEWNQNS